MFVREDSLDVGTPPQVTGLLAVDGKRDWLVPLVIINESELVP